MVNFLISFQVTGERNDEIEEIIDEIKYYLLKIINRYETDQSR